MFTPLNLSASVFSFLIIFVASTQPSHAFTIKWCNLSGQELGNRDAGYFATIGFGMSCYDGLDAIVEYTLPGVGKRKQTLFGATDPKNCRHPNLGIGVNKLPCGYCTKDKEPKPSTWRASWMPGYSQKSTSLREDFNYPLNLKAHVTWNDKKHSLSFRVEKDDTILLSPDPETKRFSAYRVTKEVLEASCFDIGTMMNAENTQLLARSEESLETRTLSFVNLSPSKVLVTVEPVFGTRQTFSLPPVTSQDRAKTISYQGEHLHSLSWRAADHSFKGEVPEEELTHFDHSFTGEKYERVFKVKSLLLHGSKYTIGSIDALSRRELTLINHHRGAASLKFAITPKGDIPQEMTLSYGGHSKLHLLGDSLASMNWTSPNGVIVGELLPNALAWSAIMITAKGQMGAKNKEGDLAESLVRGRFKVRVENLSLQDLDVQLESDADVLTANLLAGEKRDFDLFGMSLLLGSFTNGKMSVKLSERQLNLRAFIVTPNDVIEGTPERFVDTKKFINTRLEPINIKIDSRFFGKPIFIALAPAELKRQKQSFSGFHDVALSDVTEIHSATMKIVGHSGFPSFKDWTETMKAMLKDGRLEIPSLKRTAEYGYESELILDFTALKPSEKIVSYYGPTSHIQFLDKSFMKSTCQVDANHARLFNTFWDCKAGNFKVDQLTYVTMPTIPKDEL